MKIYIAGLFIIVISIATPLYAQQPGVAGGSGVIEKFIAGDPEGRTEQIPFSPRYSYAYQEGNADKLSTWIVLSEKDPPIRELHAAKDKAEARRAWCEKDQASFVALKLDSKWVVDLYFLCPGNGNLNTEMLSTANGLDSIVVKFSSKDNSRLKGTLTGGVGSCPDSEGNNKYCSQYSDYSFDAPLLK